MQTLKNLIDKYGSPDILIDSFNIESKRYAIWGFDEVLELNNKGLFLNNIFIKENFDLYIQKTINRWKDEANNLPIACIGFLSYEFKNYLYQHIDFKNQLDDSFPYLWFCKPKLIKEYELDFIELSPCSEYNLEIVSDILDLSEYKKKIQAIKSYLKNGDVYQINFTDFKILQSTFKNSFDLYNSLRLLSKPEEGFFLKTEKFDILSCSPESFLKVENGIIETAPIKGTRPSSDNLIEDNQLKHDLKNSIKDKAEHLMIVDLLRNDLGKVCDIGSITIDKLYDIKTFETIHHLVTKISGKLKKEISEFEIFKALFPGGSITGAPKESAMRIIDSLESNPRKIYTGSFGYITPNNEMYFNICIRTLLHTNNKYEYGIGGGIVWDSIAEEEWSEAQQKSKILEPLL
tara:strand:+ start:4857 stop:6068 length:1212 start_codon:yes stop_codon:yes gene_type:complete